MATTIPTLDALQADVLGFFRTRFIGRDLGTESFLGKTARAVAMSLLGLYKAVEDADHDSSPGASSSAAALDKWAVIFGLSDGAGAYGRRGPVAATGGVALLTGTPATAVGDGTPATASDGVTALETEGAVVIGGGGSVSATIDAVTAGLAGNLAVDDVITFDSPPAGLTATATITTALAGGLDEESDSALLARILARLQTPPKGGVSNDYRTWCENATDSAGVAVSNIRAYVYPRRSGTGTVDTIIANDDQTGQARKASTGDIASVQAYLDSVRPVAVEDGDVDTAYMPNGNGLTIRLRVEPSGAANAFDWDDTAAAYPTVKSYPTTSQVEINGACAAALSAAIAAYVAGTGAAPRLQIAGTGASAPVAAQQVRCISLNAVPANDIITLHPDDLLVGTAVNGDTIYAGGPVVAQVQTDVLAYVDELGPSRASGYADPDDVWTSDVEIGQLIRAALDAVDASGDELCEDVVFTATVPQVTINGAVSDYAPVDNSSNPPEMAFAKLITVTA